MRVLVNDRQRFLVFRAMYLDLDSGELTSGSKPTQLAAGVVAVFGESRFPGVCFIEPDHRALPIEKDDPPRVFYVRCRISELRAALGLKELGRVEGVTA